jgi:hypothetical protein
MSLRSAFAILAVCALAACSAFQPKPFETDEEFKQYVTSLGISGLTAQAASQRIERDGFTCQPSKNVISSAPEEIVMVCSRRAAALGCTQDQTIVMQLDWVGTQRPTLAPGMRVKSIGTAASKKAC